MKTGIAFSKTQFCTDTSKYAPLFKIARYSGNDFWEVARFVVRIMEMGDSSYKQDEIYIASALVNGKAHIYLKNINGTNNLDYFATENGRYYTFYVKATTRNSQVVAHIEYSNNIGFLQATPYEYFDQSRPSSYIAVDGQSHSGGQVTPGPDPTPDTPTDPSLVHPTITLVQSDAWLNGAGEVFDDGGKNQYDVVKFTAVGDTTYSYNYGCINPAGSVIVFKNEWGNTSSIQKADIPTNGLFTTPANCVEVIMSIKYGTKDKLNMHIGTDIVVPDPDPGQNPDKPTDPTPDTPTYPEITLVQSDAWLNGAGVIADDGGKNEYDVVKFTAVGDTTYSYNYGNCINPAGSVIVFKLSNGNTSSLQKTEIPTNGQFTTPADCVEVLMSIKYGTKDKLKMHIGTDVVVPDPEPEQPPTPPVNPDPDPTPTYPEITLVQSDAWLDGDGSVHDDGGKNEYDVVKFTAVGDTTYSYNYGNCINPAGSRIVFKLSNGNTSSLQKTEIPTNGQFTTPANCIEVLMSIKHGTKDKLKMHIGTDIVTPDPEEPITPPVKPDPDPDPTPTNPTITLVQSDAWIDGTGTIFDDNGKNKYDVVKFTAVGNTTYSYNYGNCIDPAGSAIVFKLSNDNTESLQKSNIPTNGLFTTPADCVEVIMSIKHGTKDKLNMHIGTDIVTPDPEEPPTPPVKPDPDPDPTPTNPTITLVQSDAWLDGDGSVYDDGGKNEYDVVKFTATGDTDYSYNYADCINRTGSRIVFKLANGNTHSIEKANIPNNGVFTTPADCVEVLMSIKYGTKDILNMRTGSYPSAPPEEPEPEQPPTPPVTPDQPSEPVYPEIIMVQSDAWIDGTGAVFDDGGKNEYDVVKFTATGNTDYSYNYADCINRTGSRIVFKLSNGNTHSIEKANIPNNGVFTTPADCVEVMMSIKYGSKDNLNMRTGSYPSTPPEEPDPEPEQPPVNPDEPTYPEITLVQSDAWLNGAGEVFDDNGKNQYDVVKFTAVGNTTYSYNYADCINRAGSVIVFKFSYGNTESLQKNAIPNNGVFTTPADCVEVMMSIKYGSKDNLNMRTGSYPSTPPEEPDPTPEQPTDPTPSTPTITLVQSDAWLNGAGEVFGDGGKNEYDVVKFTAVGNTTYSYNYADCINPVGSIIVFKFSYGNTDSIQKADIPTDGQFTTPADCVEVMMSIKYGSKDSLNMHTVV